MKIKLKPSNEMIFSSLKADLETDSNRKEPYAVYNREKPNSRKPEANEPRIKYLRDASPLNSEFL